MAVIRCEIAYNGAPFHGWQIQPAVVTVQSAIQDALATLYGMPVKVNGASRTDAGVHANGQVLSFPEPIRDRPRVNTYKLNRALNALTSDAISATRVEYIDAMDHNGRPFHARHCARGKIYRYNLWLNRVPHPMFRGRCWTVRKTPDWELLKESAEQLLGERDFAGFRSSSCDAPETIRRLDRVELVLPPRGAPPRAELIVQGNAFLKNMVRIIVGTLVDVSTGALPPDRIKEILETKDRRLGGRTAPAHGLSLEEVFYPDFPWESPRWPAPQGV